MSTFPSEATVNVFAEAARVLSEAALRAPTLIVPATVVPAASNKAEPLTSDKEEPTWSIVAEIELPSEKAGFTKPKWLGKEVSLDPRFFNSNLVSNPFRTWKK